jgi:hypothetical protein
MKHRPLLPILFCLITLLATGPYVDSKPSKSGSSNPIPFVIKGKTIEIRRGMTSTEIKTSLSGIITEEASLDTEERLQFDIQLVEEEAPVTIIFDFSKKGILDGVMIDSFTKEQNPVVTKLLSWLKTNAGKPQAKSKRTMIWIFGGWKIEHQNHGTGEDSVYSIELTPQK